MHFIDVYGYQEVSLSLFWDVFFCSRWFVLFRPCFVVAGLMPRNLDRMSYHYLVRLHRRLRNAAALSFILHHYTSLRQTESAWHWFDFSTWTTHSTKHSSCSPRLGVVTRSLTFVGQVWTTALLLGVTLASSLCFSSILVWCTSPCGDVSSYPRVEYSLLCSALVVALCAPVEHKLWRLACETIVTDYRQISKCRIYAFRSYWTIQ